jgi:hypothetical protein
MSVNGKMRSIGLRLNTSKYVAGGWEYVEGNRWEKWGALGCLHIRGLDIPFEHLPA